MSTTRTNYLTDKDGTDAPNLLYGELHTQISTPSAPASGSDRLYFKTDDHAYIMNQAGEETSLISASGGSSNQVLIADPNAPGDFRFKSLLPVNYILENDAEYLLTTGWSTYADSAANIPVDGTGGSPNSTWAASGASPLAGNYSFIWTKSGSANRQGEGVSNAFTIDSADQGKVLSVQIDYILVSGTFVASDGITAPLNDGTTSTNAGNSDLEVFVYDVTNSQLIYVNPEVLISNSSTTPQTFKGIFQTASNSTSYRLIIHTATTSTANYVMKFDRFYLGPQTIVQGPALGDWQSYSPSNTQGFGTLTNVSLYWRRIGDNIEIKGNFTTGTVTAVEGQIGIPSGMTIASGKSVSTNTRVGSAINASAAYPYETTVICTAGNTYLNFSRYDGVVNPGTPQNGGTVAANTTNWTLFACIPISGWSSNNLMSNDAATRVVSARYRMTSDDTTDTSNPVNYDFQIWDTHAAVTTGATTWKFTAPVSGFYRVSVGGYSNSTGVTLRLYKNGVLYSALFTISTSLYLNGSLDVQLASGDYIDIRGSASSTLTTDSAAGYPNHINIELIQGPTNITSTEPVHVKYSSDNSQAITAGNTVNFEDKEWDSHSAVITGATAAPGTSSWRFIAPYSGFYIVSPSVETQSVAATAGQFISVRIYINASANVYLGLPYIEASGTSSHTRSGTTTLKLNAGDYVQFALEYSTAALTTNNNNRTTFVTIDSIGN